MEVKVPVDINGYTCFIDISHSKLLSDNIDKAFKSAGIVPNQSYYTPLSNYRFAISWHFDEGFVSIYSFPDKGSTYVGGAFTSVEKLDKFHETMLEVFDGLIYPAQLDVDPEDNVEDAAEEKTTDKTEDKPEEKPEEEAQGGQEEEKAKIDTKALFNHFFD